MLEGNPHPGHSLELPDGLRFVVSGFSELLGNDVSGAASESPGG